MAGFMTHIGKTYGTPPSPTSWVTQDPDELANEFYNFLGASPNDAYCDAFSDANGAIYQMYRNEVASAAKQAKMKLAGLTRTPQGQQATQRQLHMRTLAEALDDKAERILSQGRTLHLRAELQKKQELEEAILMGRWASPLDNTVPPPSREQCNTYKLKHFGADSKAARYLGRFDKNYHLVKALEEKAKDAAIACDNVLGEVIFRFDEQLGSDGEGGTSRCIRVDSIESNQHSHPFPETSPLSHVSHDSYVKRAIIKCHNEGDRAGLLNIAKYLTMIGAARGDYAFSRNEMDKVKDRRFEARCIFWNP